MPLADSAGPHENGQLVKDCLKYNILVVFIHFLREQMGRNISMGMGPQLQKLEAKLKMLESLLLKDVKTAAAGAGTCTTTVLLAADAV